MMATTMAPGASTFFEHLPIGAWRSDVEEGRLHANPALQRLLGLPDGEAVHRACSGRPGGWHEDPDRHAEFLRLLAQGEVTGFVSTLRRAGTGETLTVREHAWTVRAPDGHPLRHEGTVEDITSERQAEAALQLTLDNAGRGIIRLDAEGRILLHNRRVLQLLDLPDHVMAPGADSASLIRFQAGRGDFGACNELVIEHARDPGIDPLALLQELATRPHYLRRTRDGRILEVTSQALADGGVVRTYSDVTDYVQVQEDLREKTRALQITLDSMDQGIAATDASGRTVMHNRRYQELLDLPDELLATLPTMEELTRFQAERGDFGPDFGSVEPAARESVRGNLPLLQGPAIYRRKTLDGRTLEVQTRPLPGGGAVRTFTDVSARLQAQEALAHKQAQLAALVNNLPDRVWLKDLDGVYLLTNPAQCKFVGLTESEIVGRTSHELFGAEVGERQRAVDARAMAATQPLVHEEPVPGPTPGSVRHMEVVKVGMRDDEGRCIGVLGIARDITVRKQAEAALIHARDVAQAGERAKAEFLANMSHEIRTPLNAVIGLGDLLATTPLTATQQTYVQAIRGSGAALLQLINDILDFSKAEAGRLELEHAPLHLRDCLDAAVQMVRAEARAKGLALRVEVAPELPVTVLGDAGRLRQVVVNLVSNAVKFTAAGEVSVTAAARLLTDGRDGLRLAVRDTGIGIPADRQDRLFQSFSQVDASTTRRYGGTGLGLAICKRLVELMGGTIGVQSQAGAGSEFHVDLPCFPAAPVLPAAPPEAASEMPPAQAHEFPLRLLLAEDNEINQLVAEHMLQSLGYEVAIVGDGQQALDAIARAEADGRPFDAVLMDVQMPLLDGLEATRRLVAGRPGGARPWVVALTANAMEGDRALCLAAGMDDYLSKPLRATDLAGALRRASAGAMARRA